MSNRITMKSLYNACTSGNEHEVLVTSQKKFKFSEADRIAIMILLIETNQLNHNDDCVMK